MDFKEFREKAKAAGLAVDQHSYKGKQFVYLLTEGAIAIPAGSESLHRLFAFAEKIGYELRRKIEDHHAVEGAVDGDEGHCDCNMNETKLEAFEEHVHLWRNY
jgi:hypothetical protein